MENGKAKYTGIINSCGFSVHYEGYFENNKHIVQTMNKEDLGGIVGAEGKSKNEAKENLLEAILKFIAR